MSELGRFKQEFADRTGVQFNCAGLSPISKSAALEVARITTLLQTTAGFADPELIAVYMGVRETLAKFLDADVGGIAMLPNCSTALSTVALGYPLTAQDAVVTIDQEYSSNFYPWKVAAERAGAKLVIVESQDIPPGAPVGAKVTTDDVIAAVKPGVKLVGVSWVQFQTGSILDLKRLGDHCHSVGADLVVDGIQGIGQLPFSFKSLPVDAIAGASHKWTTGPIGQGFLALKPELLQKLSPIVVGGGTFNRFGTYADPNAGVESSARRFEPGGFNFLSMAGFKVALDLLMSVGFTAIAEEISRLTARLRIGLLQIDGVKLATPTNQPGGHTSFILPTDWEAKFLLRCKEEQIALVKRGAYIRTAIHAFSNDQEVDQVLTVLQGSKP